MSCGMLSPLSLERSSDSRCGRLGFVAACLPAFGLIAALITWGARPGHRPRRGHRDLGPRGSPPAGLAVTDLNDVGQLQARFNADQGSPQLVLALAPT